MQSSRVSGMVVERNIRIRAGHGFLFLLEKQVSPGGYYKVMSTNGGMHSCFKPTIQWSLPFLALRNCSNPSKRKLTPSSECQSNILTDQSLISNWDFPSVEIFFHCCMCSYCWEVQTRLIKCLWCRISSPFLSNKLTEQIPSKRSKSVKKSRLSAIKLLNPRKLL